MSKVTGRGDWNVICKVCGFQYKASETKTRWDGLQPVCKPCFETRHPMDLYRGRADNPSVPYISKDPEEASGVLGSYSSTDIVADTTAAARSFGNTFAMTSTRYAYAVRVFVGIDPNDETSNGSYTYTSFKIWSAGGAASWTSSGPHTLARGMWHTIMVSPNVTLTSGSSYTVSGHLASAEGFGYVTPRPTLDPLYMTYTGSFTTTNASHLEPTTAYTSNLILIDVLTHS